MELFVVKHIEKRIVDLDEQLTKMIYGVLPCNYDEMSISEKRPFRIVQAEKGSLEMFLQSHDIEQFLKVAVKLEYYEVAQGIKNALDFIEGLK